MGTIQPVAAVQDPSTVTDRTFSEFMRTLDQGPLVDVIMNECPFAVNIQRPCVGPRPACTCRAALDEGTHGADCAQARHIDAIARGSASCPRGAPEHVKQAAARAWEVAMHAVLYEARLRGACVIARRTIDSSRLARELMRRGGYLATMEGAHATLEAGDSELRAIARLVCHECAWERAHTRVTDLINMRWYQPDSPQH